MPTGKEKKQRATVVKKENRKKRYKKRWHRRSGAHNDGRKKALKCLEGTPYYPSVTNERKIKIWRDITRQVNLINACNDREWKEIRKKYQDVTTSARKKARTYVKKSRKTGGGVVQSTEMTRAEVLALDSVAETSV